MKTTAQIVIASSLALIGGLSAVEGKKPTRPPKLPPEIIAKFDKDGDGKLNEEEKTAMKEHRKKMALERFDKDRDGALSVDEKAEMKKEMGKFRGKGPSSSNPDREAPGAGL